MLNNIEMKNLFMTASWNHLIMANYSVDPGVLEPFLPRHTALDAFEGKYYVSLVGFLFDDVKLRGWTIPFHKRFPEVNLRFYVRYKDREQWKRGVVFISEIVPKPAISWVANTIYKEHYSTMPVTQHMNKQSGLLSVSYTWTKKSVQHQLSVTADPEARPLASNSFEEFITEHFWGYSGKPDGKTVEYQVAHPRWNIFPVKGYDVRCDFGQLYGTRFAFLNQQTPVSVFLAEGSTVEIFKKKLLEESSGRVI